MSAFQVQPAAVALVRIGSNLMIGLFVAAAAGVVNVAPPLMVSVEIIGVMTHGEALVLVTRRKIGWPVRPMQDCRTWLGAAAEPPSVAYSSTSNSCGVATVP